MAGLAGPIVMEREGNVIVVRFTEDQVTGEEYVKRASDELKRLAIGVGGKFIFSLENVRFISSAGVSTLILFGRLLRSVRGRLKLCDIQPLVLQLFVSGGFSEAFDIHDTKAEAVAAYAES